MTRRARRWDDPQFKPTSDSSAPVKTWRDSEYMAGRPSGLLDYYRAHAVCIACRGCGLHPSPAAWDRKEPLFIPCKLCFGSGEVRVL
jgi:hypothetical protein